jgi:hypothetical protein
MPSVASNALRDVRRGQVVSQIFQFCEGQGRYGTQRDITQIGYVRGSAMDRQSHQVIALAATGRLGIAAAGQIR